MPALATKPPSAQKQPPADIRHLALVDCFTKATWVALSFALVCLGIDAYAMFGFPHHPTSPGNTHGVTLFAVALWTLEIVLALLALWLVRFAFSRPPRFPGQPEIQVAP